MHRFPAEVGFGNAREVLAEAAASLSAAECRFDLSACQHFDSSLLAILLELSRRAHALGARCRFEAASENLLRLAGLYGVAPLLFGVRSEAGLEGPGAAPAGLPVPGRA